MNNKAIQEMLSKGQQKAQEKVDFNNQLYEENSIASSRNDLLQQDINAAKEQSELYLKLLRIYIGYIEDLLQEKKKWKKALAWGTIVMFFIPIPILGIVGYGISIGNWNVENMETIYFCIGSFLSFISAVSFLPKFIAGYLFNKNTEDNIVSIVTENQKHDIAIRRELNKN